MNFYIMLMHEILIALDLDILGCSLLLQRKLHYFNELLYWNLYLKQKSGQ
jgi:hypothetical protein